MMNCRCALLLLGGLSLWLCMSPVSAQVPGPIDYDLLTSTVVNLFKVKLTWPIPTGMGITGYNITYCTEQSACNNIFAVPTSADSRVSLKITHDAPVNTSLSVTIFAMNAEGDGSTGTGPKQIPVATFDQARPIIKPAVLTSSFMIAAWDLPATAQGNGISVTSYTVSFVSCCSPVTVNVGTSTTYLLNSTAIAFNGTINVMVTPTYSVPLIAASNVVASSAVVIPSPDAVQPVLAVEGVVNKATPKSTVFSWSPPPNTDYLLGYNLSYTMTQANKVTSRSRRAVPSSGTAYVAVGSATSVTITTCPFCEVVVDVDVLYTGDLRAPLLSTTTFITDPDAPTAPRNLDVVKDGVKNLKCTWLVPDPTNGIIINYIVLNRITNTMATYNRGGVGSNATYFTIIDLSANTLYDVVIVAETSAGDGPDSSVVNETTGFGVTAPSGVSVEDLEATFTLSGRDGAVARYMIVVSTTRLTNTTSMRNIPPYGIASADLYVTKVDNVNVGVTDSTIMVKIGSGESVVKGGKTYVDQQLDSSAEYYIFIRAFSDIDGEVFNDSPISDRVQVGSGTNVVAIAVPIVVIYLLLMVILIVVIVLACHFVGNARKLRKKYPRKSEAERRQQAAGAGAGAGEGAAMNLVNPEEGGRDGSASPTAKNPPAEAGPVYEEVDQPEEDKTADS